MADTPHTAFPLRYLDGRPVLVDQDSHDHMRDRIEVACLTPRGEALHDPTFGIDQQLLRVVEVDLDVLAGQLSDSEPSIAITVGREQDGASGMALPDATDETVRIDVDEE